MNNSSIHLPKHSDLLLIIKKLYGVEVLQAARRYILTAKKIACLGQHLAFNWRCQRYHVLPGYLHLKFLVPSAEGYKIAHSTGFKYLSARVRLDRQKLRALRHDHYFQLWELRHILSPSHLTSLQKYCDMTKNKTTNSWKERHKKKFDKLLKIQEDNKHLDFDRWVINRSSKKLNTPQKSLLSKGMNFAPAPKKSNTSAIIAKVENVLYEQKVDVATANNIRSNLSSRIIISLLYKHNH